MSVHIQHAYAFVQITLTVSASKNFTTVTQPKDGVGVSHHLLLMYGQVMKYRGVNSKKKQKLVVIVCVCESYCNKYYNE